MEAEEQGQVEARLEAVEQALKLLTGMLKTTDASALHEAIDALRPEAREAAIRWLPPRPRLPWG